MINRFIGCSFLFLIALILTSACGNGSSSDDKNGRLFEKTSFQTASPWKPELDVCADVAIIYGCSDTPEMSFEERVKSWKEKGYKTHFMTGIAWGE